MCCDRRYDDRLGVSLGPSQQIASERRNENALSSAPHGLGRPVPSGGQRVEPKSVLRSKRDHSTVSDRLARESDTGAARKRSDLACWPRRGYRRAMRIPSHVPLEGSMDGDTFTQLGRRPANYVPLTPTGFLERAAAVYPQKPAVIHGERTCTYHELYARARRLASALTRRGIGIGDTVAVMAPNVPAMLEAH